ncbi:hypothetical protein ACWDTT_10655 [Streptosporangium sandarakinum]
MTTLKMGEHKAVEIRDWVHVPDPENDNQLVWHPTSGIFIPMDRVTELRKALQKIEADNDLVKDAK